MSELLAFDFCNITQITTTQLQQVVSYVDFKSSIGTVGFGSRIEPSKQLIFQNNFRQSTGDHPDPLRREYRIRWAINKR